jgi:O-antigen/teichoic acid export membrane protein
MVSMDRFLIGILLSVTQVAYYATPAEIIASCR